MSKATVRSTPEEKPGLGTRRKREWKTLAAMIALYCHQHHASTGELCGECQTLAEYAQQRLLHCPFSDQKPTCVKCPIHCYKPACREQVREVMRYAGPRLLLRRPILTIRHLIDERAATPPLPTGRTKQPPPPKDREDQ